MNPDAQSLGFFPERLKNLNTLFKGYVERGELAGMIAMIARHGQTAYYEKFGWMDREAQTPMRDDTIFMIASMTKPITSVAIMKLYEQGYFQLNTPVAKFIPAFNDTKVLVRDTDAGPEFEALERPITFRHLFTHTSGLSYGDRADDPVDRLYQAALERDQVERIPFTNKRLAEQLPKLPLAFQPGTKWRYGLNTDLLAALIEIISGTPYEVFLQENLFQPLGMTDTAFYVPAGKAARVATVYGHPNAEPELQRLDRKPASVMPTWTSGGGGLVSTMHDYARFAQMLTNGGQLDDIRILAPKTVEMYSMNHTPSAALPYGFRENDLYQAGYGYSLGTRVLMDISQSGMYGSVGEFGWDGAFSTYFWIDPHEDLYGLLMLQHFPNAYYPVHQQFKQLTYQAMTGD